MCFTVYFFQNFFLKKNTFFLLKVRLGPSISQENFGGIRFSELQQFFESENFDPLGAGDGEGGDARCRILADGLLN